VRRIERDRGASGRVLPQTTPKHATSPKFEEGSNLVSLLWLLGVRGSGFGVRGSGFGVRGSGLPIQVSLILEGLGSD
jgi:hypothetical protein